MLEREGQRQVVGFETVGQNGELIRIHVVPVDTEHGLDSPGKECGEPFARTAAEVDDRAGPDELDDERHDDLGGTTRVAAVAEELLAVLAAPHRSRKVRAQSSILSARQSSNPASIRLAWCNASRRRAPAESTKPRAAHSWEAKT